MTAQKIILAQTIMHAQKTILTSDEKRLGHVRVCIDYHKTLLETFFYWNANSLYFKRVRSFQIHI